MHTHRVRPLSLPFDAVLPMPGSKSQCNRALIAAALSAGQTIVRGMNPCDDVRHMVNGLIAMGWDIVWTDATTVIVGERNTPQKTTGPIEIFCGNAGTTIRFLTALAAMIEGEWIMTGDPHMLKRPIASLVDALTSLGAGITSHNGCPPLAITGGQIQRHTCILDARKSSQYLSALLLVGPLFPEGLTITLSGSLTSPGYIDMTQDLMKDFGIHIETKDAQYHVPRHSTYSAPDTYQIEGDWSAAGAFLVLTAVTKSRLLCPNLKATSLQGDRAMPQIIQSLKKNGDRTIDCTDFPDQMMNLCICAALREGTTTFTGAKNLRHKECDRLAVITRELTKVGITITQHDDGVTVSGRAALKHARLNPEGDHRMAMAFAVLGCISDGITIEDPSCVEKTYPQFWNDLETLHAHSMCIAIVGMRGVGKTTCAKKLGAVLQRAVIDTDAAFTQEHGPIADYVAKHGWASFRSLEEDIVERSLQRGCIVSLGGGAIESKKTREALQRNAITIWLQARPKTIENNLASSKKKRPALTELRPADEIRALIAKRNPLYRAVSHIRLPVTVPYRDQIDYLLKALHMW